MQLRLQRRQAAEIACARAIRQQQPQLPANSNLSVHLQTTPTCFVIPANHWLDVQALLIRVHVAQHDAVQLVAVPAAHTSSAAGVSRHPWQGQRYASMVLGPLQRIRPLH
jgi:hypothetical protein